MQQLTIHFHQNLYLSFSLYMTIRTNNNYKRTNMNLTILSTVSVFVMTCVFHTESIVSMFRFASSTIQVPNRWENSLQPVRVASELQLQHLSVYLLKKTEEKTKLIRIQNLMHKHFQLPFVN